MKILNLIKKHGYLFIKNLTKKELIQLSHELRKYIFYSLNKTGGHLSSNLGSIEFTIALHYAFNFPYDSLTWDVGHQAYAHKILTGRDISNIRSFNGIAPFPKISESIFDTFGAGHAGTAISAALGIAEAEKKYFSIAIIGDGSITSGMSFEAINHAGYIKPKNLIIILNNNGMSISKNIGAIHNFFIKNTFYNRKNKLYYFFKSIGFNYHEIDDGHDMSKLLLLFSQIKKENSNIPYFIIINTIKGKGIDNIEKENIKYHAVKKNFLLKKEILEKSITFSDIFGKWLCEKAKHDKNIIGISPAMCIGSGMKKFSEEYKNQYYDVGIAEQHAITFAAGLSLKNNKKPIVSIYSTFMQRGYDQIIHDIALQKLNVTFIIDRAGINGEDGPTHQGTFDMSFLNCIPNIIIMIPSDVYDMLSMLDLSYNISSPVFIRIPKKKVPKQFVYNKYLKNNKLLLGKSIIIRRGKKIALLVFGILLKESYKVAEIIDATVINMRFLKPIDKNIIQQVEKTHEYIFTIEENTIIGGAGSIVSSLLNKKVINIGIKDKFLSHGRIDIIQKNENLHYEGILNKIKSFIKKN